MSFVTKVRAWFEGDSRAATMLRHFAVTALVTFGLALLPVLSNVGTGAISFSAAGAAAVAALAGGAAALTRVVVPVLRDLLLSFGSGA